MVLGRFVTDCGDGSFCEFTALLEVPWVDDMLASYVKLTAVGWREIDRFVPRCLGAPPEESWIRVRTIKEFGRVGVDKLLCGLRATGYGLRATMRGHGTS